MILCKEGSLMSELLTHCRICNFRLSKACKDEGEAVCKMCKRKGLDKEEEE